MREIWKMFKRSFYKKFHCSQSLLQLQKQAEGLKSRERRPEVDRLDGQ